MMTTETCGECKFFRRVAPMQPMGTCHAGPPTLILLGRTHDNRPVTDSFWPMVPDTEFCGGWKQAPRPSALNIDLTKLDVEQLEGNA